MERARESIREAKAGGAELVIFPEAFLPGYPTWLWRLRPGGDMSLLSELHARLLENSVDMEAGGLAPVCDAARESGVTVVMGLHERDGRFSRSTLYNTCTVISPDGDVLNRHRKLVPTNPERTVWGRGDASGLRVVETPAGRIGTLICWECYVPLARHALYSQNVEIFVAPTWDTGERWHASMRHIAAEGGCWVASVASAMQGKDVPDDVPGRDQIFPEPDEWINAGDAVVMAPFGGPVAGPMHEEQGILYADCDLGAVPRARRSFDVAGHYHRPDVFELTVNRKATAPIHFEDEG